MSGSPSSPSWCSASWSAWTCRASSPTRASGASASVISAPDPRRRKDSLMTAPHAASNFDQAELDKFAALANRWWDDDGPQKPLHALNPVRLKYVADRVPLRGARVLDIGCGGGLLSEALAQAGADRRHGRLPLAGRRGPGRRAAGQLRRGHLHGNA
ncbi:hypothetical protein G6F63_015168 [Rhizopus arrhizus]|nr:hypothetical protein G6F63_015168 [Rhizopus arrhizus]